MVKIGKFFDLTIIEKYPENSFLQVNLPFRLLNQ